MKQGMALQKQIFFGILFALTAGFLMAGGGQISFDPGVTVSTPLVGTQTGVPVFTSLPTTVTPTAVFTPGPFVTISGVRMVRIIINRNDPPIIERVTLLETGRITPDGEGDNHIQVLDNQESVLYTLQFPTSFQVGEPPQFLDSITMVLFLPRLEGEKFIRVQSRAGEVIYEIR